MYGSKLCFFNGVVLALTIVTVFVVLRLYKMKFMKGKENIQRPYLFAFVFCLCSVIALYDFEHWKWLTLVRNFFTFDFWVLYAEIPIRLCAKTMLNKCMAVCHL